DRSARRTQPSSPAGASGAGMPEPVKYFNVFLIQWPPNQPSTFCAPCGKITTANVNLNNTLTALPPVVSNLLSIMSLQTWCYPECARAPGQGLWGRGRAREFSGLIPPAVVFHRCAGVSIPTRLLGLQN